MSTLSLPPLSAVRPEKQYDTIMRYLFMLVEELNSRFDEAGSTVEKTVGDQLNSFFGDEFGDFSTIQADIGGIRARVADAEGNISTVTQTVSGLSSTVSGLSGSVNTITQTLNGVVYYDSETGSTVIDGSHITTGTISAERLNLTGAITFGDLSTGTGGLATRFTSAENNASSAITAAGSAYTIADAIRNGTVTGTFINGTTIYSPTIIANSFDVHATSDNGEFNLYGNYSGEEYNALKIDYGEYDDPFVEFSSPEDAYAKWDLITVLTSKSYGEDDPNVSGMFGREGQIYFVI